MPLLFAKVFAFIFCKFVLPKVAATFSCIFPAVNDIITQLGKRCKHFLKKYIDISVYFLFVDNICSLEAMFFWETVGHSGRRLACKGIVCACVDNHVLHQGRLFL